MHKKNKKYFNKVEKICQQIRQDPNCNCVVFHRFFYKHRVRLFEHENMIFLLAICICKIYMKKLIYPIHVIKTFLEIK